MELKAEISLRHGKNFRHTGALAVKSDDKRWSSNRNYITHAAAARIHAREICCVENGEIVAIAISRFWRLAKVAQLKVNLAIPVKRVFGMKKRGEIVSEINQIFFFDANGMLSSMRFN